MHEEPKVKLRMPRRLLAFGAQQRPPRRRERSLDPRSKQVRQCHYERSEDSHLTTGCNLRDLGCSPCRCRSRSLLEACDLGTWTGRRDHAMFALTIQTGLRISELAALTRQDVTLTVGANVHTIGKGRKERRTPLVAPTKAILHAWLCEYPGAASDPLFPTITGGRLSRDAIERRLAHHIAIADGDCPSLQRKRVTMHTLRHTAAMRLLLAGNDVTVIALWLGHEQLSTTNIYLHADMTHKQQAIDRTRPLATKPGRYRPPDTLLAFLEAL